ncbi:MAG: glycosyltransferase family 2 protein [Xanthomarina sp.]
MNLKKLLPSYSSLEKPSEFDYKFTVFTPLFNRANTIHRVFDSLEKQTYKDFELLIINDGSKDNSHEIVQELISKSKMNIQYINNEENRHKMACIVQGTELAKGEFFLPLDSDDECVENALEILLERYNSIPNEKKSSISGVTCLCKNQHGNLIGEYFKTIPLYSSSFENRLNELNLEEKWGFVKMDILRGISINPELYSKGYIPEGILWNLIAKHDYKTLYTNDVLRIYHLDTANRISKLDHKGDAFGMMIFSLCILNWFYKDYFWKNPKLFLIRVYSLIRAAIFLDYKRKDYIQVIESFKIKALVNLSWPFKKQFFKIIG